MKRLISLILAIIIFSVSCGLPDVTSITLEMNQPFITKLIPGPNSITVEFQSQNNEPAFSGYNIYFGDSVNPQKYRLYNSQKARPTISVKGSADITTHTYTIQVGSYYSQGSGEILTLTADELKQGIPIYVWVSAYQITPQNESYYYYDNYVKMATPRPETLGATVSGSISLGSRQLATLSGSLNIQNTTGGIQSVSASSLSEVTVPPTNGYSTASLPVVAQQLYLTRTIDNGTNYYGKIFVRSVSGSSANVDYCLQTSGNILSY
ncbi:hypothetical protein [Brachyspira sp.]|uniref:hypothetical protein n=1 Tax=Brachyspira sp. TaxID=1977261 RepID=UPI003D7D4BBF